MFRSVIALSLLFPAIALAAPQSSEASRASAISLAPSVEAGALSLHALDAGSELIVTALRPVGDAVELALTASATGASAVLRVGADSVRASGVVVGATLVVTAVSAGVLISAGAEVIAFVPNQLAAGMIHHRPL